jgi:hypothetical protein
MTTNKTESPLHYQALKQKRLQQIQQDYFPPPPKSSFEQLFSNNTTYTSVAHYPLETDQIFSPHEQFTVRKSSKTYAFLFYLFFFMTLFTAIPTGHALQRRSAWIYLLFMVGCTVYAAIKLLDKRPHLAINAKGIQFNRKGFAIGWPYLIAAHIYEKDTDEDTDYQLVVDYYDAVRGQLAIERFTLGNFNKSPGQIAAAIHWFGQRYAMSAESANLTGETV